MIREGDVRWWVLEAREHPESAPAIVEELARRLLELDAENERLRSEAIRSQYPGPETADTSELAALRGKVARLQELVTAGSPEYSLILLSSALQAARIPLRRTLDSSRQDRPAMDADALLDLRSLLLARSLDDVLLITSKGRGRLIPVSEVPLIGDEEVWQAREHEVLGADEWLSAATTTASAPRFWTIVTRRGFSCQHIRIALEQAVARGDEIVRSTLDRDEARAIVSGDADDLLVVSRWGAGLRFPQRAIASSGSLAMELEPGDEIAAALPMESELEILIVTATGYAVRRDSTSLKTMTRPGGSGKPLIRAFDVLGAFRYAPDARLLFLTQSGGLVLAPVADMPLTTRYGKGQLVCDLSRDPALGVVCVPAAAGPTI